MKMKISIEFEIDTNDFSGNNKTLPMSFAKSMSHEIIHRYPEVKYTGFNYITEEDRNYYFGVCYDVLGGGGWQN